MIKKTTPETAEKVKANVNGRIMFSNSKAESILLILQPSEIIPEHTNPFDVLFIGLESTATISSGDQTMTLEPCATIYVTHDEPRQMQNLTDKILRVMVVKFF